MNTISELTAEQQARFPEFVEKWTRIGLCTEPANRPAAEEGVRLSYRIAGLEPPQKIVWCGSPLSMGLTRHIVELETSVCNSALDRICFLIRHSVRVSVVHSVRESVRESVRDSVVHSVRESVMDSVAGLVGLSFRASVGDSVGDSVRTSVWNSVRDSVGYPVPFPDSLRSFGVWHALYEQNDASWYALFEYFRVVCGLSQETENMLGLMQVAENAGWWLPLEGICWVSERPNRLKLDDRGRLHCEDGPALSYPDGWSIYAIHGVPVNEQIIMHPRSQDVDAIRNEPDAEVKRVRIERFGWPEYLRDVGAVVIDTRDNDVEATKEALMMTPDGQFVLVCACPSTGRVYSLEVPPGILTCEAAQDWLSGGLSHRVINGA